MRQRLFSVGALMVAALQLGCAPVKVMTKNPDFPDKKPLHECKNDGTCSVAVYVGLGAQGECQVQPEFELIQVLQGKHPKVSWSLDEKPNKNPVYDYRFWFDPAAPFVKPGVSIAGNDPNLDFDDPGYDVDGNGKKDLRKFKWRSVNEQKTVPLDYVLNVQRREKKDGGWTAWTSCTPIDPKIINDGA